MPPRIYLVSEPSVGLAEMEEFLGDSRASWRRTSPTTPAEQIVEAAGRICYMSFGEKQSPRDTHEYVKRLVTQGHESVLEHVSWGFIISGVSRAFTHQLVRHRVGFAFSQLSQQYHDEGDASFVEPWNLRASPRASAVWKSHMKASVEAYREITRAIGQDIDPHQTGLSRKEYSRAMRSAA